MKTTGVFGGSFNPIHNGHISLAQGIQDAAGLDEVWFVVSPLNPFKKNNSELLPDEVRLRITEAALAGHQGLTACDYEFHLPRPSYMWNTLQGLTHDYPDRRFSLIIGGDNWERFHDWYHADDIIANHEILIYPRADSTIDTTTLPPSVHVIPLPLHNISSTEIRRRIKEGRSIRGMVPESVRPMIQRLYC